MPCADVVRARVAPVPGTASDCDMACSLEEGDVVDAVVLRAGTLYLVARLPGKRDVVGTEEGLGTGTAHDQADAAGRTGLLPERDDDCAVVVLLHRRLE